MRDLAVSVVMPTWDRAQVLPRALHSALAQLRPGDEIIVVDDGSTDGTRALLASFDAPVRAIFTSNRGAGAARNVGIAEARSPLVAFLDSDDEWMPGSLEARRRLLEARPDLVFCFGDFAISLPDGRAMRRYLPRWHADPRPWSEILAPGAPLASLTDASAPHGDAAVHIGDLYAAEMRANYVLTSSLLVRRAEAGDALHFEAELANGEDWVCFGRLAARGPCAYIDAELAWQHGDAAGRISCAAEVAISAGRVAVLERVWGRDARFLAAHGQAYAEELDAARLRHVRALLAAGRSGDARVAMDRVAELPRSFRLLAALPRPLLGTALGARRLVRKVSGAERRAARAWEIAPEIGDDESHTEHANR